MMRSIGLGLLTVLGLMVSTTPGQAQVIVRAPGVTVMTGKPAARPGVVVHVPGILHLEIGQAEQRTGGVVAVPPEAPRQQAEPLPPPGGAEPRAAAAAPEPNRQPPTLEEFASRFQPRAGKHEVVLMHPATGQPGPVRFELPAGAPKDVHVSRRSLEFDYGEKIVEIRFRRDGRVDVAYDG